MLHLILLLQVAQALLLYAKTRKGQRSSVINTLTGQKISASYIKNKNAGIRSRKHFTCIPFFHYFQMSLEVFYLSLPYPTPPSFIYLRGQQLLLSIDLLLLSCRHLLQLSHSHVHAWSSHLQNSKKLNIRPTSHTTHFSPSSSFRNAIHKCSLSCFLSSTNTSFLRGERKKKKSPSSLFR